jgi:hypothetical protein
LSFTTIENPIIRELDFLPGTVSPTSYRETDDAGRSVRFDDPGPDRVMPSPDDIPGSYTVTEDRVGDTQLAITFGPGPDGAFFTSDDAPIAYSKSIFEGLLRVRNDRFGVGPDGLVESGDEILQQVREEARNSAGQLTRIVFGLDGGDNIPGSADDNLFLAIAVLYDERGLQQRTATIEPGPDGEFATSDDVIPDGEPTILYDERGVYQGQLSDTDRSTIFVDNRGVFYREDFFVPGADNLINTPDDAIFFRVEFAVPD